MPHDLQKKKNAIYKCYKIRKYTQHTHLKNTPHALQIQHMPLKYTPHSIQLQHTPLKYTHQALYV